MLYVQSVTSYYMFPSFVYIFLFVLEFFFYLMLFKRMTETCSRKYFKFFFKFLDLLRLDQF